MTSFCPRCGKLAYQTEAAAGRASRSMRRRRREDRGNRAYRCGDMWHLTAVPKSKWLKQRWQR